MEPGGAREINEIEIRKHYALLRHSGFFTVVHCQDVAAGRMVGRAVVKDADGLVDFARAYNGKGNVFIARNPREDAEGKRLSAITCFSLDIDPERPKGTAATSEQRGRALGVARRILSVTPGGALLDSGNGYQIFYTWAPLNGDEKFYEAFAEKAACFVSGLLSHAKDSGCRLDAIHDNERLVKLAGTLSCKGAPEHWRQAAFIGPVLLGVESRIVRDRILAFPLVEKLAVVPITERPFEDDVITAARALSRLGAQRGVDYDEWLRIGMALRGLGDAGLALWDNWSKRRQGYETGACAEKWKTIEPAATGEGITIGTLVKWAADDSSHPPREMVCREVEGTQQGNSFILSQPTLDVAQYLQALPARAAGESEAVELPTGIQELDAFGPLLARGHIFTIGAYTNVGKTTLAATIAAGVAKLGKKVLFFSTENTAEEVMDRLVMSLSGGWGGNRLEAAKSALTGLQIAICDSFTPSVASMEKTVREAQADLLVFDYLQHAGTSSENRVQEIDKFVKQLHDLARANKVAVLATAQLSRASTTEELALRHLRECGTIENESRAVLLMKRLNPNLTAEIYPVAAVLAKNKGRMGGCQLIVNAPIGRVEGMGGTK